MFGIGKKIWLKIIADKLLSAFTLQINAAVTLLLLILNFD